MVTLIGRLLSGLNDRYDEPKILAIVRFLGHIVAVKLFIFGGRNSI